MARALWILALVPSVGCSGSSSGPPSGQEPPGGKLGAEILVGYYSKIAFSSLAESDQCPVLWGLQGGNWTMPTVRARRMALHIQASGKLAMGNEELGHATMDADLVDRGDGWLELTYLPIPVSHAPPNEAAPIDDIYQKRARLTFSVVDENGQTVTDQHDVVLIQSEVTE